ncbi:hypothetical protein BDF20DRAFT_876885 [Mycotypha africana]|uniref:uncharacterized protein n=1 Tax=Mycotypha africana TaxID=64632 RepID=UPI002301C3F2|nr:uncharacterized protein BDF20DRAFT_876885 [Mycotypha africana]KAI8975104.1 hypothetical protein BDF20DRAFT_876885 [Mycotypha africana]
MLCIYHYIEVIFQFGQKFEEIKMKVPVIVASIPVQNSLPSSEMIKYTFEENRRAEYLEYSLENSTGSQLTVQQQKYSRRSQEHQRQQQQFVTSDSLPVQTWHSNNNIHDGNNKISRGSQILQEKLAQFANDNSGTSSNRIRHEHIDRKKNNCTFIASSKINPQKKHDDLQSLPRIAVYSSATESLTAQGQLRKIASAQDLSINRDLGGNIHQSSNMNDEKIEINEERPRTATPTMRSGHQCLSNKKKPLLQPIDVYLANGGKNFGRTLHLTERPLPPVPGSSKYEMNFYSRSSDDILVTNRRGEVQQQRQGLAFGIGAAAITNKFWQSYDNNINVKYQQQEISSLHNDSDFSSSSVTISITNRSNEDDGVPSLQSRPPSPAFCPAPGLPATIALRPQQQDHPIRAVEEWFPPLPNDATGMLSATNGNLTGDNREEFITISPTINTIASSTVLSPNAALAYYNNNGIAQQEQQKRFALSTISSLINDPLQRLSPSPSLTSYNNNVVYNSSHQNSCNINKNSVHSTMMSLATVPKRMRSSSSVDPDMQQFFIKTTAMDHYPLTSNNDNIRPMHIPHSPSTIHRFKHEQLPPLPSKASNSSSSMSITTPSSSFRHQIRDNNINPSVSKDEENVNKRLTLIYLEDSDEEEEEADTESTKGSKEEKKHGTANLIMNNNENSVLEEQPPRQSFQLTPTCIPPRRASSLGIPNNIPLPTTSPTFINNIHNQTTSITATTNTNTTATTMNHLIDDGRSIDTEEESNKLELFENLTPPELPRLSFGNDFSKDFGLSLGLNF